MVKQNLNFPWKQPEHFQKKPEQGSTSLWFAKSSTGSGCHSRNQGIIDAACAG
jgi:hypothetical protein